MTDSKFLGQIKFFNESKDFGFITRLDDKREFYFRSGNVVSSPNFKRGTYVEFLIHKGPRREHAEEITAIADLEQLARKKLIEQHQHRLREQQIIQEQRRIQEEQRKEQRRIQEEQRKEEAARKEQQRIQEETQLNELGQNNEMLLKIIKEQYEKIYDLQSNLFEVGKKLLPKEHDFSDEYWCQYETIPNTLGELIQNQTNKIDTITDMMESISEHISKETDSEYSEFDGYNSSGTNIGTYELKVVNKNFHSGDSQRYENEYGPRQYAVNGIILK